MADITVRWGGPSDAGATSTYKVERSLDLSSWTELAASQAATSPYVSPSDTLNGAVSYDATTIELLDSSDFSAAGYGWLDGEALVQWTGNANDRLTGVTWHSGYGTYATGSVLVEAHESYADTNVTPNNNAVVYRITHTNPDSLVSPAAYIWYYYPPTPVSGDHCVVVVSIAEDLGIDRQASYAVTCQLASDNQFSDAAGAHLDQAAAVEGAGTTNALGLAFFHCWKNSARAGVGGGSDAAYTFTLGSTGSLSVTVSTIPDRDWVLLSQVADAG